MAGKKTMTPLFGCICTNVKRGEEVQLPPGRLFLFFQTELIEKFMTEPEGEQRSLPCQPKE